MPLRARSASTASRTRPGSVRSPGSAPSAVAQLAVAQRRAAARPRRGRTRPRARRRRRSSSARCAVAEAQAPRARPSGSSPVPRSSSRTRRDRVGDLGAVRADVLHRRGARRARDARQALQPAEAVRQRRRRRRRPRPRRPRRAAMLPSTVIPVVASRTTVRSVRSSAITTLEPPASTSASDRFGVQPRAARRRPARWCSQVITRRATGPTRSVVSGASGTLVRHRAPPYARTWPRAVTVAWPAMPRSFDMAADYDGSVEQVHSAFGDEQYWLARLADSGADERDAGFDDGRPTTAASTVATTQVLRGDRLPGVVTPVPPRRPGDRARGDVEPGPRRRRARRRHRRDPRRARVAVGHRRAGARRTRGSRLEFTATVEVRIPLVGGKVENFIGSQLVELVAAEQRFTTVWITDNA